MVPQASSSRPFTYLIVLLMLLATPLAMAAPSPLGEVDERVIDPYLRQMLDLTPGGEVIEVVVQFEDGVFSDDLKVVSDLGLDNVHQYTVVPALWLRGRASAIERLAGYDRVRWMEFNEQLEYLMDETTNVINATRTWYSTIEGSLWGAQGITGKGVTVVVLDSGIDAGHPDLDYGTKTIRNLKSDTGTGPWYEVENGDTSSGHGTHVAGTVAGNGDASAGQRRGVAPGANLIGLSAGETLFITGGLGGLDWTYEHSRPGNNPYNIRVCTNSWGGGGGQYDPQDAISQAINGLVYENNVAVSFAAGNSGGEGNDIQASNYGNTPAAICVAASTRDGFGITDFSSKGQWDWVDTWPDIAAPGENIQSTAARRTIISLLARGADANPYYFPISGTSMATPHVAGAVALLFQAAPSLRVSEVPQDVGMVVNEDGVFTVSDPDEGTYGNLPYTLEEWLGDATDTLIHESELILKLTAAYLPPEGEGNPDGNGLTTNFVPDWSVTGFAGERIHDFSQGYGQIDVHKAVGLALTLERIRWDHPEATVFDAYSVFNDIFEQVEVSGDTDRLSTSWRAEWSRFNDQLNQPAFTSNLTKFVKVPEGAEEVTVTMSYRPVDTRNLILGSLGFQVDYDNDGTWDYSSPMGPNLEGTRTEHLLASGHVGESWKFGVVGYGLKFQRPTQQIQFQEVRMEVDMAVSITFSQGQGTILVNDTDLHAINGHLSLLASSPDYIGGNVSVLTDVYNISNIAWSPPIEPPLVPEDGSFSLWWLLLVLVVILLVAFTIARWWPETSVGRLVLRVATVTGIIIIYRLVKGGAVKTIGLVPRFRGRGSVVKAELVEEGESTT